MDLVTRSLHSRWRARKFRLGIGIDRHHGHHTVVVKVDAMIAPVGPSLSQEVRVERFVDRNHAKSTVFAAGSALPQPWRAAHGRVGGTPAEAPVASVERSWHGLGMSTSPRATFQPGVRMQSGSERLSIVGPLLALARWGALGFSLWACAPKRPEVALARDMKRYDRQLARQEAAVLSDDTYFLPVSDALAAAAAELGKRRKSTIASVTETSVSDDWTYTEAIDVDRESEYLDQTRERNLLSFAATGGELELAGTAIRGTRRLRPQAEPAAWTNEASDLNLKAIRKHLAELERQHLAAVHTDDATAALADFAQVLPEGFEVTESTDRTLQARRIVTRRKETRRGAWATWDARTTLRVTVEDGGGSLAVHASTDHRISTPDSNGVWQPASEPDAATALDWLAAALRIGIPKGHEQFGPALLPPIEVEGELSSPPPPPPLRTMAEIEQIIEDRAVRTATGNFTVCLEQIDVERVNSAGQPWDVAIGGSPGPDLAGTIAIGGEPFRIPEADNTFRIRPGICAMSDYYAGNPYAQIDLWDMDLGSHDEIASCPIDLQTIALQGAGGIPCMSAQLTMSASYNFSFEQIDVVGLPPPDTGKKGDVLEGIAMENLAVARQPIDVYVLILNVRDLAIRQKGAERVAVAETAQSLGLFSTLAAITGAKGSSLWESVYLESAAQAREQFAAEGVRAAVSPVYLHFHRAVEGHAWNGTSRQTRTVPPGRYPLLKITISDPLRTAATQSGVLLAKLGAVVAPDLLQELVRSTVEQKVTEAMAAQGGQVLMVDR